jgi:chromosome segregation ATPase
MLVLQPWTVCEGVGVTEVFLSYDSSDRDRARPVRDALTAQGFDVAWDQEAPPGADWETWVRRRLARSKCVVLLRSAASAQSNRMSHVAAMAEARGRLIVVRLEPRSIWQTLAQGPAPSQGQSPSQVGAGEPVDLANWSGELDHPGWQELCRRIDGTLRSSLWVQRLIHDVEAERARWRAQYEISAARWKALNGELAHERSERGAAQDKVAGLEAQLDAVAKARLTLQTSIVELEQRLAAAEARAAEARLLLGEEVRQKGAQLAEVETALAREQDEAVQLKSEVVSFESVRRELSARVAAHEATIAGLGARLAERDAEAEGLRAAAVAREAELASLRTTLAERDAEVARLTTTVTQRDADVASLRVALAQRDADIGSLRRTVEARTADVGGLTVALGQRDAEVRALRAGTGERDSYMADLEASVTQRDTYIARLTASLADGRAYMADLEASIAQRDTHIADLKTNLAERDIQIANLKTGLKEAERRSQGRHAAGVPLRALGAATLPVLAGVAMSVLKIRQG